MRFLVVLLATFSLCAEKPVVLVSVPPLEYFAKALVGDDATVQSLVPEGISPHTYSPTPKQVANLKNPLIWFRLGELSEKQALDALQTRNPEMKIVDLCTTIALPYEAPTCSSGKRDPHIWLSARIGQEIAVTMAQDLQDLLPESPINSRLDPLLSSLRALDHELSQLLAPYRGDAILVSHPAFTYFCLDYDLHQLAVESHGKEPSAAQLTRLLKKAKEAHVRAAILEQGFSNKGAERVAEQLKLPICTVNPLSEDVPSTLEALAGCITRGSHE